ncbi:uncharacterized protein BCR38DRAFT_218810 [Pseudomassariella vexata]|uniref:2EXR domain-containing protein n=1 Tax=Pseudomassariella vexata TaxID=1141098 RepID=A0A1Y2DUN4_9PEZI|nr:uncharacterized protein BCR38DRAFT_218810 [Pseudomassariella vexata]ORY62992.1 hypothetical protein BCR38DRAFT_218810 [Pseudomassariella vexata]
MEKPKDATFEVQRDYRVFIVFPLLPSELQMEIWKMTLPDTSIIRTIADDGKSTLWPVITMPKPPNPGHCYGEVPAITQVSDPEDYPVALCICHLSRQVALHHTFAVHDLPRGRKSNFTGCLISRNDIVNLDLASYFMKVHDGLPRLRASLQVPFDALQQTLRAMSNKRRRTAFPACWQYDHEMPDLPNPFFDLRTGKYCIMYPHFQTRKYLVPSPSGFNFKSVYCKHRRYVAVRLSDLEEWIFGSKIILGTVCESLVDKSPDDPGAPHSKIVVKDVIQDIAERPFELGAVYIMRLWRQLLHVLAFGGTLCGDVDEWFEQSCLQTRDHFAEVMRGGNCHGCDRPVLPAIQKLYGDALDLAKIDIFVLTTRDFVDEWRKKSLKTKGVKPAARHDPAKRLGG